MNRQLTIELRVLKGLFAEENFVFNSAFKILTVRFTAECGLWHLPLRYHYNGDVARAGPGDDCVVITLLVADCRPLVWCHWAAACPAASRICSVVSNFTLITSWSLMVSKRKWRELILGKAFLSPGEYQISKLWESILFDNFRKDRHRQ